MSLNLVENVIDVDDNAARQADVDIVAANGVHVRIDAGIIAAAGGGAVAGAAVGVGAIVGNPANGAVVAGDGTWVHHWLQNSRPLAASLYVTGLVSSLSFALVSIAVLIYGASMDVSGSYRLTGWLATKTFFHVVACVEDGIPAYRRLTVHEFEHDPSYVRLRKWINMFSILHSMWNVVGWMLWGFAVRDGNASTAVGNMVFITLLFEVTVVVLALLVSVGGVLGFMSCLSGCCGQRLKDWALRIVGRMMEYEASVVANPHPIDAALLPHVAYDSNSLVFTHQTDCVICFTEFKQDETVVNLTCRHMFHESCLSRWLRIKPECPHCRTAIVRPQEQQEHQQIIPNVVSDVSVAAEVVLDPVAEQINQV